MKKSKMTIEDVERMFYEGAKRALEQYGSTALELLETQSDFTLKQLAALVNHGITIRGLKAVIYEEAQKAGKVREVAKDLLYREILHEYPNGWYFDPNVAAFVKLGFWDSDIERLVPDYAENAAAIIRELTIENPPPEGWFPQGPDDPLLEELFDKHWPREES